MHTKLIIKAEYLELPTEESATYCTEGLPVAVCSTVKQETPGVEESAVIVVECTSVKEDIIKHETPGVEESAVIVVECTTVKEEIKEENMDTEDPLSVQGKYFFTSAW